MKNLLVEKKPKDIDNQDNPCFSCSIEQECCRKLRFLRLTKTEYLQHFAKHQEILLVQSCGQTCLVSSLEGQTCPNLINNKCAIYTDRPIECQIFPYTLGKVYKANNHVFISYHERTHCPQKKALLMSQKVTKKLLLSFAHEAFGNNCMVEVKRERLLGKLMIKLRRRFTLL